MEWHHTAILFAGFASGGVLGFVARRNFFCTLSSLEQFWYTGNSTGIRTWAFAGVVAAALTLVAQTTGLASTRGSFYLNPEFGWLGAIVGGIAFGFGMALVGTCGFGALVRLGGGSLKSLMAVMVLGLTAISAMRGMLALSRTGFFDGFSIDFSPAPTQSIPDLVSQWTGLALHLPVAIAVIGAAAALILWSRDFRTNRQALVTGGIIGAVIAAGWVFTTWHSGVTFDTPQIMSASFVAPVADTLLAFAFVTGSLPGYGVGMVLGTVAGAALAARLNDDVRWEACDDARELSRHIMGAALMGFGGILTVGCTIGQGVSAASLLAISVPVVIASIVIGARLGLAWLIEGSFAHAFRR